VERTFTTARLVVRQQRPGDAELIAGYHNDPAIAEFQDWPLPSLPENIGDDQLVIEADGQLVGDLYVDVRNGQATIGYSLAPAHHGKGYAVEVVGALVDHLFAQGVHRVHATTDPKNFASMAVLERVGFRYEGRFRKAALVRGEWLDDEVFALLHEDRVAWFDRPHSVASVVLVEITEENCTAVGRLATHHSQEQFVAPMWASTVDACAVYLDDAGERLVPWTQAIVADGVVAGFVMCAMPTAAEPYWYLWRLLIDRMHQRRGIGAYAIAAVVEHVRSAGGAELRTSWVPARGGPEPFYRRLGFVETGEIDDGEVVAALQL
jgi:RimJ/RimL family protein N-acetyltransferase